MALLIHGAAGSAETWWRVAPALVDAGWTVMAADLPGHGASPRRDGVSSLADFAGDVAETLNGQPVDVAWGHSGGAMTAMYLALDHGHLVRRLLLEDPPGTHKDYAAEWRSDAAEMSRDPTGFVRQLLIDNPAWEDADALGAAIGVGSCDTEGLIATAGRWRQSGLRATELLAAVEVPALLVLASRGAMSDKERARAKSILPPEAVMELESGHVIHRDRFDDIMGIAFDWLQPDDAIITPVSR
jgi:pimeloyl-ACP methyl ester carboxylesterase